MKPILLIAFLALGPALADQLRPAPPVVAASATASLTQREVATVPPATLARERTWLCGG